MNDLVDSENPDVPRPAIVEQTGIALVHEGERISAVEDSMAHLGAERANVVRYVFPVEVEIVGDELSARIFEDLRCGFDALG